MIREKIESSINSQINAEIYSAYLYLSMSVHFASENLAGFASWMKQQAKEEMTHALKFQEYLIDRGGKVKLTEIKAPPASWESPEKAFEAVYNHEQHVTSLISAMMDLSIKENDHATTVMLQWFISEQVEEEATASAIYEKIKLTKNNPGAIYYIDRELSMRGK